MQYGELKNHSLGTSLAGQLLIAMPQMQDHRFERSVIYLCVHNNEGAFGLVINKLLDAITLSNLMEQLGISTDGLKVDRQVHFGGPVDPGRGFVLHSPDYREDETMQVGKAMALTATMDILRAIGKGQGPARSMLALGYAGWGPGQLDREIQDNGWLHGPADETLIFDPSPTDKWTRALASLGIGLTALSAEAGHA